ncbi:MAG: vWA domain-containing protein [Gammaproteobacteria bacterium]
MIHFQWPWLLLLLPLPYLVYRFTRSSEANREAALRVPFLQDFSRSVATARAHPFSNGRAWLLTAIWLLLLASAMRPQWLGDFIEFPVSGRELMLAVDLSQSMSETDFVLRGRRVTRLAATKFVAGQFIERRVGDKIGLILYGDQAYLQTPLTFDRDTVAILLNESEIGLAGKRTAIGDAIGLAVKRLRDRAETNRIVILLTDGANTAGAVQPLAAAELAAQHGLKIYTIGVGADETQIRNLFGTRTVNPSADLDEPTLQEIARLTNGRYFRARDLGELENIYALLDELEPVEQDVRKFRPRKSMYYWPLGLAFVLAAALAVYRLRGGR